MAQLIGLARIGRDAEVRYTTDGTQVASLSLAFSYGRKDQNGNKPTQWVEASLWGQRAESLAPYLLKGAQIVVTLDDPHIETFQRQDGTQGHKLVARVSSLEFAGSPAGGGQNTGQAPQQRQQQAAPPRNDYAERRNAPQQQAGSFADMDDDLDSIPF